MNKIIKEKIKQFITLLVIIIAFLIVIVVMFKYENEGEKNMPFFVDQVMLVSSADMTNKSENPNNSKWNVDINQYNDIYINIEKNKDNKELNYIESVCIENIKFTNPNKGTVNVYIPNDTEEKLFDYEEKFKINDKLVYKGSDNSDVKKLEISNQGGMVLFRIVNKNVSEFVSNENLELNIDGKLLEKTGINYDDVKFKVSFDLIINTKTSKYKSNINIDLPSGDIANEGVSKQTIDGKTNIVFKRENT